MSVREEINAAVRLSASPDRARRGSTLDRIKEAGAAQVVDAS